MNCLRFQKIIPKKQQLPKHALKIKDIFNHGMFDVPQETKLLKHVLKRPEILPNMEYFTFRKSNTQETTVIKTDVKDQRHFQLRNV